MALPRREQPQHGEVMVSAETGEGMDALLAALDKALFSDPVIEAELRVPQSDGAALASIEAGMIVHQRSYREILSTSPSAAPRRSSAACANIVCAAKRKTSSSGDPGTGARNRIPVCRDHQASLTK